MVLGLGLTGLSVARYLKRKNIRFVVVDSRIEPSGMEELALIDASVPCYFGSSLKESAALLNEASVIVISPGVPRQLAGVQAAVDAGVEVIGDIELFLRHNDKPVIGITGSNGKTTVTSLVGQMCKSAGIKVCVAGNIGLPVLDCIGEQYDLYVLELSSFQLESVDTGGLQVACILNISEDHMDRYNSLVDYSQAKQKIYRRAKSVVYNLGDKLTTPAEVNKDKVYTFSMAKRSHTGKSYFYDTANKALLVDGVPVLLLTDLKMVGLHNVENALAALAICDAASIDQDAAIKVLREFKGLPHRCQWVANKNGVSFINDSKATNVGAAEAALEGLRDSYTSIVLIAGGDGKGADFKQFGQRIGKSISSVVLIGRDAKKIAAYISGDVKMVFANSMNEAVSLAYKLSEPRGAVLLSPACASFDMFTGFEDRGQQFCAAVEALVA